MSLPPSLWAQLYLYPLLVTLVLWGGLTLGLLWLNQRGPRAGRLVLLLLLPVLGLAHWQLWTGRNDLSAWGCYSAFLMGMFIWTWHELAFYCGVLTGPWRDPCPMHSTGWRRFGYAIGTHLYHEAAVVVELGLLWWLHQDSVNLVGPLTFWLLWLLQHSAKFNVFLGVRTLQVSLFPQHLRYLGSFWYQRTHNPFFPASVCTGSLLALVFWLRAGEFAPQSSAIGMALLASVLTLGVLEHWLLMWPTSAYSRLVPAKSGQRRVESTGAEG